MWRLDRWGRSLADLVVTLQELASLNVGFVCLNRFDLMRAIYDFHPLLTGMP